MLVGRLVAGILHRQRCLLQIKLSANLDFLRAVAVLLVLAQHLLGRFQVGVKLGVSIPPIGTFGVLLFFVHTCLVLMYSMERSQLSGKQLVGSFYLRRLFRIYPLSMLAVLTAVALHLDSGVNGIPGLSHAETVTTGRIVSNLFLVQNLMKPGSIINVLWSLPYEVQMYVFLPFLFMWIRGKRRAVWRLSALWVVFVVLAFTRNRLLPVGPPAVMGRLSLLDYVPNFLPGIIAFTLVHTARIRSYLWPPFVFLLIAAYAIWPSVAMGWAMCLVLGFAIPFFGEIKTEWVRTISNRIATYSYGIYLSHQFCIWFVSEPMGSLPAWSRGVVLVVSLVGIPIVLYHAIEKPMIKVGADLAERWNVRQLVAVAADS
jgi:peptidoglycan/LPS O-acetylase OafA/YrhL